MTDLVYPELSFKLVGILFDVYNELGFGFQEKYYYRAIREALKKSGISFKEQEFIPLKYQNSKIGSYFADFIIEDKIVLEIKQGERFLKSNIAQVYGYLKAKNLKLGLIINFTKDGVKFKRIINIDSYIRKD